MAGIQVQSWDADFADSADYANSSWRRELSTRERKSLFFLAVEECSMRQEQSPRSVESAKIRVPTLNLDAGTPD
jgi:hypothetical protein